MKPYIMLGLMFPNNDRWGANSLFHVNIFNSQAVCLHHSVLNLVIIDLIFDVLIPGDSELTIGGNTLEEWHVKNVVILLQFRNLELISKLGPMNKE